ncbi:MAG: DUF58 domain-containing protein [Planctomycetes bacterium]|nr:DUF58 domain-containing protein [Planctomycetota bacterium]
MEDYRKYLDPKVLSRIEGLQLRARLIVEGYVSGIHRSPYHGFSVEFAEHREYAPGDDLRYVDWKVFGRTDKFYLKQFEEETNLVAHILLDTSESMSYQSDGAAMSKLEYARSVAAALSHLILRQADGVGLVTFDDRIRTTVRASSNPSHLEQLVHVMADAPAQRKTATGRIFHELAERFSRRGIVIILSDLFDDVDAVLAGLKHFRHRRHEVVLMHVLDPAELDFPFRRTTMFCGLEEFPDLLVDARALRKAYLAEFERFVRRVERGCRRQKIDYVQLRTDQSLEIALSSYLASRMTRAKG